MLFKGKQDIIGLDIGSSSVKLVQLRQVKGSFQLVNAGVALLPPETIVDNAVMDSGALIQTIRDLVESHKIKTKNVASSISGHSVIIRKIQLPVMTQDEMEASIQWEAEQYIPFDISEVNLDFQILGPDEKDPSLMSVILVAAKKEFVNDYMAVFTESGLKPQVMDVDSFAIENVFEANYPLDEREIVALINMGASTININVLKGGVSAFTRDIQIGGNIFNTEIQKRLGLSGEDAEMVKLGEKVDGVDSSLVAEIVADVTENLTQEVQRSIDFFSATSGDQKVQKLYVAGGVSKMPQMKGALERRLGIPTERLDPFREVTVNEAQFDPDYIREVAPFLSVATGLAMRRLGDK
jgi:type IV pilus assembly protein PilM